VIGDFYKLFFPQGGLIADQANAPVGSSRVASLGPGLRLIGLDPLFGGGYGARAIDSGATNAFIVDDQWLSSGIDTGILGIAVWAWFFIRFLRPVYVWARRDRSAQGWLFSACAASMTAFAIGMLTFDAFSFIQTTFVMFVCAAIGSVAIRLVRREVRTSRLAT
jgi:hypothetical protein